MMGGRSVQISTAAKRFPPQTGSVATCGLTPPKHPDCAKLADAADKAVLANHTYGGDPTVPSRYEKIDPNTPTGKAELGQLGVSKSMLEPSEGPFKAEVFKVKGSLPPEYVVAYRGTAGGADWKENFKQGVGLKSDSYEKAMQLGQRMNASTGGNVSFTGHSLGGGLASAAAGVTGRPATTFNAAGLNADTVSNYPPTSPNVDAYYVPGEVLSGVQDNRKLLLGGLTMGAGAINPVLGRAVSLAVLQGEIRGAPILPPAYGTRHALPVAPPSGKTLIQRYNPVDKHGMDWVSNGIKTKQRQLGCI
jgi:Protein of unknown function (DUF2974)